MGIMPDRFNSTSSPFQVPPVNTYPSTGTLAIIPNLRDRVAKALSAGVLLGYKLNGWTDEELIDYVTAVIEHG